MKVTVVGAGYVGLTTGICMVSALERNSVDVNLWFLDVVKEKIDTINAGKLPIFEPGLQEIFDDVHNHGICRATRNYTEAIAGADFVILALPTPSKEDGSIDLGFVEEATASAAAAMKQTKSKPVLVYRSTVLPGTTDRMRELIKNRSGLEASRDYWLCMNPEHLQEGTAVRNFVASDKLVIGQHDEESGNRLQQLYTSAGLVPEAGKIFRLSLREAEMEKYFSNAFLATKVSFSNQMANICEALGINYDRVRDAACADGRLGKAFTVPGIGFGGSCFSKDLKAIFSCGRGSGVNVRFLEEVIGTNEVQPRAVAESINRLYDIRGKKIGILGVTFKGETDDLRSTMVLPLVSELRRLGAEVLLSDPYANNGEVVRLFGQHLENHDDVIRSADVILVGADHKKYHSLLNGLGKPVFDCKHSSKGLRSIGGIVN